MNELRLDAELHLKTGFVIQNSESSWYIFVWKAPVYCSDDSI